MCRFISAIAQQREAGLHGGRGEVGVQGRELSRDGQPWIPHGHYQIAFEVAPGNPDRAKNPFWEVAYNQYSPDEYREMRAAGADSVRLQIAQVGADPQSQLFDQAFVDKVLNAVCAARDAGLSVMIAVQDETHREGDKPIDLPDEGTRRVWRRIAPQFARDRGELFELLNELRPQPTPQNLPRWAQAMMATIRVVREVGAINVVIADGPGVGQVLDGAPLLPDQQFAYASHPYALRAEGQTHQSWDRKFGNFSRRAPAIITEWLSAGYFCDSNTPESSVEFLRYLNDHKIGLEVGAWDWAPGGFGSARWGFPDEHYSTFKGPTCHQKGYGLGESIRTWYTTGSPPSHPE